MVTRPGLTGAMPTGADVMMDFQVCSLGPACISAVLSLGITMMIRDGKLDRVVFRGGDAEPVMEFHCFRRVKYGNLTVFIGSNIDFKRQ